MNGDASTGWDPEHLRLMAQRYSVKCPDDGAPMELREGKNGLYYGCSNFNGEPRCLTTHRAYQEGEQVGGPIGRPAPRAVRQLRKDVYALAEQRWNLRDPRVRREFNKWLGRRLKIAAENAQLTRLSEAQLTTAKAALEREVQLIGGGQDLG